MSIEAAIHRIRGLVMSSGVPTSGDWEHMIRVISHKVEKDTDLILVELKQLEKENAELREDIFLLLGLVALVELKSHPAICKVQQIREKLTVYPTSKDKS